MNKRIELNSKVRAIYQISQLDQLAKRQFMVKIQLGSFNELVVRFVRKIEQSAWNVDFINETTEIQKVLNAKGCLHVAKMNYNS